MTHAIDDMRPQTFPFTAEQLTKFVANVVIQIAQPQVCYPATKQDMLDLKSSMCRKFQMQPKSFLSVDITGKDLFESIGSLRAPAPPPPPPQTLPIREYQDQLVSLNHLKTIHHLKSHLAT